MAAVFWHKNKGAWCVRYRLDDRYRYKNFQQESAARAFAAAVVEDPPKGRGGRARRDVADRIRESIAITDSGCWEWQRRVGKEGYGVMSAATLDGAAYTIRLAHRVSYERFVGPIPTDKVIDHLCRNRACVNPDHLEPVTQRENVMRSPIAIAAINAAKTHCPHGHPYSEGNTYTHAGQGFTQRICRTCVQSRPRKGRTARRSGAEVSA